MNENLNNIFGCFIAYPPVRNNDTMEQKTLAESKGDFFRLFIYRQDGICEALKQLKNFDYGNDLELILFQFNINPFPFQLSELKDIESYRKKERSIGIPIIVTDENFFSKTDEERDSFLKRSFFQKLELLNEVVKKRKLDTRMDLLKADCLKLFGS